MNKYFVDVRTVMVDTIEVVANNEQEAREVAKKQISDTLEYGITYDFDKNAEYVGGYSKITVEYCE